jgi:cellulose synthase/poly-beta-1,6-N-acetylglucosamine synthase-like glycosyltransferase
MYNKEYQMSGVNRDIETSLAVIVPAYNEENGIDCVLQQLADCLQDYKLPYEIVVVDDGSQDKTATIAKSYSLRCFVIRLIKAMVLRLKLVLDIHGPS